MSLTGSEQRFVLAEMIKSSSVDVHALASFVRANCVVPDWYNMQLPNGRNLNQCIKFAQSLSISTPLAQQPSPSNGNHAPEDFVEFTRRHMPPAGPVGQLPGFAPATLGHLDSLPRPANGVEVNSSALSQASKPPAKKRGRPSRSETSRRDLPPREPLPIAPRPPLPIPGSSAPPPRTILPAMNRSAELHASLSLASSPPTLGPTSRGRKRPRLTSPPATPAVKRTPTSPRAQPAPGPPADGPAKGENASNGRENSNHANKTPTPESNTS